MTTEITVTLDDRSLNRTHAIAELWWASDSQLSLDDTINAIYAIGLASVSATLPLSVKVPS